MSNQETVLTMQQLGNMAKNLGRKSREFMFKINSMTPEHLGEFLIELSECGLQWLDVRDQYDIGSREWLNITSIIEGLLCTGIKACVVIR